MPRPAQPLAILTMAMSNNNRFAFSLVTHRTTMASSGKNWFNRFIQNAIPDY